MRRPDAAARAEDDVNERSGGGHGGAAKRSPSDPEPAHAGCGCDGHGHGAGGPEVEATPGERPAWAAVEASTRTLDARPMLAAGDHPVSQVMETLGTLAGGEVFQLVTPFLPRPLIERAQWRGFLAFSVAEGAGLVRTFFRRAQA